MATPYSLKHARANGVRVCLDCSTPMESGIGSKKKRVPLRCARCRSLWEKTRDVEGQREAHKAVQAAIRTGTLRAPGERRCADCGGRADRYDHRDYSRALDVDPVCVACNLKRGHGAPRGGLFSRLMAPHLAIFTDASPSHP